MRSALGQGPAVTASGLWGSSVAAVVGAVRRELRRPVLLVCGHLDEADDLADDVELFSGARPDVLPALELTGGLGRVSEEQVVNRLKLIGNLARAREGGSRPRATQLLVAPIQALMQSVAGARPARPPRANP